MTTSSHAHPPVAPSSDWHVVVPVKDTSHGKSRLAGAVGPDRADLSAAIERLKEIEDELRQSNARYAALTRPKPLDAAAIRSQVLDGGALLLEYSLGPERSTLWVVTPASVRSFRLPRRAEIEKAATAEDAARAVASKIRALKGAARNGISKRGA